MRSLTNVISVIKCLILQVIYKHIQEYTQVRSLTNVISVIKCVIGQVIYKVIKEYTQVISLTNVIAVTNCLIGQVLYKDTLNENTQVTTDEDYTVCEICDKSV